MSDLLLLAGALLCVLSIPLALVALLQTRAPRGAAASLVLGIALMILGAWLAPEPFRMQDIGGAWSRLTTGQAGP